MVVSKAYRFRLYPTVEQAARLDRWSAALRFLWNLANEQRLIGYARPRGYRHYLTGFDQINELTALRAELPWLADVPRNVCAQLLVELDKAWQRCFKKLSRAPRWKRKGRDVLNPCEPHPKCWRLAPGAVVFPKLGAVRAVLHRMPDGKPKTCTIVRDGDQWFASCLYETNIPDPTPRTEPTVALDRGVVNIVGDSDGTLIPNPRHLDRSLRRLRHAQRRVSRRKKGSKNRAKAVHRVARIHRKVRRQRAHFLHCLSATYAKSHGTVVIEDLNVQGMSRSRLARHILGAAWSALATMLKYKLAWSGGRLVEVPAAYSSQTCSVCGYCAAENRVSQARFRCARCGLEMHADLNAPLVLKSRANRSALPVEGPPPEGARRSRKSVRLRVPRQSSEKLLPLGRG